MTLFSGEELDAAMALVRPHVPVTPQYAWPLLAAEVGAEVWVKHENHTPTGAFKVRGGLVHLSRLTAADPSLGGIISATRGNHGQSLAYAGRVYGVAVTILVPHGNGADKNAAMRAFGAEVIEYGDDFQDARERAVGLADDRGLLMVPPFQRDLVNGVATYARELFDAAGQLDAVYVPVGMGSGICGLITVRDLLGLDTEIVGVIAEQAPATKLSFDAGRVVNADSAATFADGVATRSPDPTAIEIICGGAARIVSVSEDEIVDAMRLLWRTTHNMPEPAGAVSAAGLWSERDRQRGRRIGVILTGSNVDASMMSTVLAGETPTA